VTQGRTQTRRELNLAIFEGTADRVLWQPRLETWIEHHTKRSTLPDRFRGMTNLEIYDELRCSIRYEACVGVDVIEPREDVVTIQERHADKTVYRTRTPLGELTTVYQDVWEEGRRVNSRIVQWPVKTIDDLRALTWLVERKQYRANLQAFEEAARRMGDRGEPTVGLSSSGFTELIKDSCGLVETFYLLYDHTAEVEAYLEACDRRDDRIIDAALELPCRIFNLGDHATNEFTPPPILEKYLLPRWQRISDRLHAAGRFVHSHWDGHSITMLPYARATRLDGLEALTPAPMGDMTLEQIKDAVGDRMVVLDLLRAIDFLPSFPVDELLDFARKAIDMFAPRLILGISDEISQVGEIDKVEAVSELVEEVCGLAS
jgi:hypothetical protein